MIDKKKFTLFTKKLVSICIILLFIIILIPHSQAQVDTQLKQVSLYEHSLQGKNQEGQAFSLESLKGKYVLLSFFYASCNYSCPILLEALKNLESKLNASAKNNTHFTLISLDPKNDTPQNLKAKFVQNKLDNNRWTMMNISEAKLREITAIVDMKYRRSGKDIHHSTLLLILDPQGKVIFSEEGLADSVKNSSDLLNKLNP